MHFWQVVTRLRGAVSGFWNHAFIGAIPEFIRSRLASFFGTSGKLPSLRQPFDSKKLKNFSLNSFTPILCIGKINPFYNK